MGAAILGSQLVLCSFTLDFLKSKKTLKHALLSGNNVL